MPRRRKKSCNQRSKLSFVESPLNLPRAYVSPILNARNPPTADVKYLDDDASVEWVSPQFSRMNSCAQPRRSKRRKCQVQTNQTLTSGQSKSKNASIKENKTSKKVLEKYRPLAFLDQNPICEPESETDSFEMDVEDDITLRGNENNSSKLIETMFTRLKCNSPVTENQITPSLDCQFNTPEHIISDNNDQVAEPETNDLTRKCVRSRDRRKMSPNTMAALTDHNWTSDRTIPILCQTDDEIILEMREKNNKSRKVTLGAESPNLDTPRRRSQRQVERQVHKLTFGAADFPSLTYTPQREALDELATPNRTVRILVDDTPELDYGLRVSLRRRRELLPHMTWVKLLHNTSI